MAKKAHQLNHARVGAAVEAAARQGRAFLRGRPRPPAPVHILANRELTAAMRQLRVATGDDLARTVAILNDAIRELYPESATADPAQSGPHPVGEKFVGRLEKGHHARLDLVRLPGWIDVARVADLTRLYTSRVPEWLVRAYDSAFCADGFLVDMFTWSSALQAEQLRAVPRHLHDLPEHVPEGREYEFLARDFPEPSDTVRALLTAQVGNVARLRHATPPADRPWLPVAEDGSGSLGDGEEEFPEGMIVAPGAEFVAEWVLHNTGTVPWRDRVLYHVGAAPDGIGGPAFLPIPDTDPGGSARLRTPLRAPHHSGTFRICLKMGWPDGTYCFPTTLLGVICTVIVPPVDLLDPHLDWPEPGGSPPPSAPRTAADAPPARAAIQESVDRGSVLRTIRGTTSLQNFAEQLTQAGVGLNRQRLSTVERGAELPDHRWEEIAEALMRMGHEAAAVDRLRGPRRRPEPAPASTPPRRLAQWSRIAAELEGNRWWRAPLERIARTTRPKNSAAYRELFARHGVDRELRLRELQDRLRLGRDAEPFASSPDDAAAVDHESSILQTRVEHGELFVLRLRLHNNGTVGWRDRLLWRLGPPVTSSLPFTPAVLPVPDTEPGDSCEIVIPGRGQWFPNLAVVTYVLVFPDFTPCVPGRVQLWVDTRDQTYDHTLPLPPAALTAANRWRDPE